MLTTEAFGGYGGIALYNRDLLTALSNHPDCSEIVAIPRLMRNSPEPLPPRITYITAGLNGKLSYIYSVWKAVHNNPRFELIICGHINLLPVAHLLRRKIRAPLVLMVYGIEAWKPTKKPWINHIVKKVDAFVSISEFTKKHFLAWSKLSSDNGFLLPNAIHVSQYGAGHKSKQLIDRYRLSGKIVLMTLARLDDSEQYKGIDEILEVLPNLIQEIPDITYLVVGDGTDRQRLQEKAEALGVDRHVVFTGRILDSEKADHYRVADVFAMPGRGEGFGFVFLEAMACGIPVIASKVDGSREAVRDGRLGIMVDPSNPAEIKLAIQNALMQPKQVVPEGLEYFSFKNFEQRSCDIFRKILLLGQEKLAH